jgi:hypothetical protein
MATAFIDWLQYKSCAISKRIKPMLQDESLTATASEHIFSHTH